ncbi:unnamed protein product [Mytilus coruscus]|uniref:Chromo domain-containing protein n=1 Tax=Mytilus coruscus TaxID=42192 RepID=A0A6J8EN50_MYTCO|nr:unnamed protein product [Mytilus coruscus]
MASERSLRPKRDIDWKKLHFGEALPLEKAQIKRATFAETFEVERLILKKISKNEGHRYLVKWDGYHISESTWEPAIHLPDTILQTFECPNISSDRLQYASFNLEKAVQQRLYSTGNRIVLDFDTDVYRFCFGVESTQILYKADFSKLPMSTAWYYKLKKNGRGTKLSFQVRIRSHVHMRKSYRNENGKIKEYYTPIERLIMISAVDALCV